MVVRINTRKSVSKALNYNEAKVRAGVGDLLLASGFGCDIDELGFSGKLRRFEQLNQRKESVKVNTLHISINFPPGEDLPTETMQRIALDYMDRIGFGDQPFLVYQHRDARHPHMHIVTTSIQANGEEISLHNIGRDLSEPAREALEEQYGLIRARGRKSVDQDEPFDLARKVQEVTGGYKFGSLDELNAILGHFGIIAWRGQEGSALYYNRGLLYSRIDADGYKTGASIRSSNLPTRPTLTWLERRFEFNKVRKLAARDRVAAGINRVLEAKLDAIRSVRRMNQQGLFLHLSSGRFDKAPLVYVIDHRSKTVFTAEELGHSTEDFLARLILLPDASQLHQGPQAQPVKKITRLLGRSKLRPARLTAAIIQTARTLFARQTGQPGPVGDFPIKKKKRKKRFP